MEILNNLHPHLYQVILICRECGNEFAAAILKIKKIPKDGVCFECQGVDEIIADSEKHKGE